jgi:hypothetical protein
VLGVTKRQHISHNEIPDARDGVGFSSDHIFSPQKSGGWASPSPGIPYFAYVALAVWSGWAPNHFKPSTSTFNFLQLHLTSSPFVRCEGGFVLACAEAGVLMACAAYVAAGI